MLNAVESRRLSRAVWVRRIAVVATFAFGSATVTACIFDDGGDYNGGGRRNTGAELNQNEDNQGGTDGGSSSSSGSTGQDSGGLPNPFGMPDAGGG